MDAGVQYLTNVAGQNGKRSNVWSADSGDDGASAWGMTGVEDIGNGYKVNFKLLIKKQFRNQLKLKVSSLSNLVVKVNMVMFG